MYYLYYADSYHNTLGYLDKFQTFSKPRIAKFFLKHERLVLFSVKNDKELKLIQYYVDLLKRNLDSVQKDLQDRFGGGGGWTWGTRELVDLMLSKIKTAGISFKIFKHEAEIKPFGIKSTQKNVKITKQKEAKVARKTTKKRKLSGNALKQKAYALIKKGAMKLVRAKGRGRKVNTRYAGKERVGVYIYKLKSHKK